MRNTICPSCNSKISKKWLLFSKNSTKYVCPTCGLTLEWTKRRMIAGIFTGILAVILNFILIRYIGTILAIFFTYLIAISMIFFIPDIFRKSERQVFNKKRITSSIKVED